jgi:hypothetical protein
MEKVRPSRSCENLKKTILGEPKKEKSFNLPLSESEIIELHNILMTPMQQMIQTKNVLSGRALLETMLTSLSYYQHVGYLTAKPTTQKNNIIDIYTIIHKDAQVYGLWHAIEQFFINYHNIDFIWIELTNDLLLQMGFNHIMQLCKLLTQYQAIPVLILQYDNNEI